LGAVRMLTLGGTSVNLKTFSPRRPKRDFFRSKPGSNFVDLSTDYKTWIPAFAGMTVVFRSSQWGTSVNLKTLSPRRRPGSNFVDLSTDYETWIPAFAGMTVVFRSSQWGTSKNLKILCPRRPRRDFLRSKPKSNFVDLSTDYKTWTPAFAGMTGFFRSSL